MRGLRSRKPIGFRQWVVHNTEMQIREYNGQRVVTLKDIDRVHEKKTDTAKKSFQKHKKHFILVED